MNQGVLTLGNTAAQSSSTVTTVAASATLGLGVGMPGYFSSAAVDALFAGTMSGVNNNGSSNVGIDTTAGNFTYSSSISSTRGLTKLGANTLFLTGSNTYGGTTVIDGGTLSLGSGGVVGQREYHLRRRHLAVHVEQYHGLLRSSNSTVATISIDTNGQGVTFASPIASGNTAGLTQLGNGTLTLTAANSYTGGTTISSGTLQIGQRRHDGFALRQQPHRRQWEPDLRPFQPRDPGHRFQRRHR